MCRPEVSVHPRRLAVLVLAVLLVAVGLAAVSVVPSPPPAQAAAAGARLSVSPTTYVGGQGLTWSGSVGHPGVRGLVLQFHMGRPGDSWLTVPGFRSRTRADGSFRFRHPAPGMFNIRYRVKAGRFLSPSKLFVAKSQDLTIRVTGDPESRTNEPGKVGVGEQFGITVDTTPENLFRSPDTKGAPVFQGRELTLQERVDGDTWKTLGSTTVGSSGLGSFSGLTESAGVVVYRVRAENVHGNGHQVGWTQSFPSYVLVGREAQSRFAAQRSVAVADGSVARSSGVSTAGTASGPGQTAGERYKWGAALWDFTWEAGESLSSPPGRGTDLKGRWLDYSDGAGRVSKHNGGLAIESKRYNAAGPGDFGTTRATLVGNPATYGRWEARMRLRVDRENDGGDYNIVTELVPARASDYDCGAHNIQIASVDPRSRQVRFGVTSPRYRWSGSVIANADPTSSHAVAVEVSSRHITWFLNGVAVGTVKAAAARSGVPMTLRLSLEGNDRSEMNQVNLQSDWQRGFSLDRGSLTVTSKGLSRSGASAGCGS